MVKNEMDLGVQYLRGVAALFVVLFHLRSLISSVIPGMNLGDLLFGEGSAGVDIFFVISGYIIALSTQDKLRSSSKSFVIKRFFRLYPPFIICLFMFILVLGLQGREYSLLNIARSAVMLHSDYSSDAPFFGYNILYPAWTLTYEVYFYTIFCVALSISHTHRVLIASSILIISIAVVQLHYQGEISFRATGKVVYGDGLLNIVASPMLFEFVAGMWLFSIRNKLPKGHSWRYFYILIVIISFFNITSAVNAGHGIDGYGFWAICIVYGVVFAERCAPLPKIKSLYLLGEISYSLYLSHVVVINILLDKALSYGYNGASLMLILVSLCIMLSIAMFNLIESKSILFGKKFIGVA